MTTLRVGGSDDGPWHAKRPIDSVDRDAATSRGVVDRIGAGMRVRVHARASRARIGIAAAAAADYDDDERRW